jgi:hypothetical protein
MEKFADVVPEEWWEATREGDMIPNGGAISGRDGGIFKVSIIEVATAYTVSPVATSIRLVLSMSEVVNLRSIVVGEGGDNNWEVREAERWFTLTSYRPRGKQVYTKVGGCMIS